MTKKKRLRKEQRAQEHLPRLGEDVPMLDDAIDDLAMDPGMLDFDIPPDLRAMERSIARLNRTLDKDAGLADQHKLFGPLGDSLLVAASGMANLNDAPPPSTPLEKAQELIYDAFETDDPRKRGGWPDGR